MKKILHAVAWLGVALVGAGAYAALAIRRGETISSAYVVVAAVCTYAIGFRFYSMWIATKALVLNDRRATPCEVHDDGKDFVRTNPWIVFGHHFAAISGPGPLVGPVLAAQFGYLPGTLWILIGCVLGGAVQDLVILFSSLRRDGKSLGQMVKDELNNVAGLLALGAILAIMIILLAVLALVVVKALAESPWGVFTVGSTIPIAMMMGGYLRWLRPGKVLEVSVMGVALLLLAVWGGQYVHEHASLRTIFRLSEMQLATGILVYGVAASVLPVWLLLAPRDYLSTFMKLGTILALALGVLLVLPELRMPAISRFVDGSGPVVPGKLFPFCFITIACGAISGFHSLIASGTTPKLVTRERYARHVGYGAMCLESLVAIMAMVAACTLEPGVYLGMNIKGPGATVEERAISTAARVNAAGFKVTTQEMDALAKAVGEDTLFGRTGGAATLAVGMARIFSKLVNERWLGLWYHFAIMFEALFILTTLDAGTRVGRYILQDALGHVWKPLGDTRAMAANVLASVLMVSGWGYFLIQGVRDPEGGVRALWPLFGIANQMLAAIALCLGTTILLKMHLGSANSAGTKSGPAADFGVTVRRGAGVALLTLIPLVWLLAVTFTAGWQKIFHEEPRVGFPRVGFLQTARELGAQTPALETAMQTAEKAGDAAALERARKKLRENRIQRSNNLIDAVVVGMFLALVTAIVLMSVREWILLIARKKLAMLRETPPTWLPDYALAESKPVHLFGLLALGFALARELSGEADYERASKLQAACCECGHDAEEAGAAHHARAHAHARSVSAGSAPVRRDEGKAYAEFLEARYKDIRRCC